MKPMIKIPNAGYPPRSSEPRTGMSGNVPRKAAIYPSSSCNGFSSKLADMKAMNSVHSAPSHPDASCTVSVLTQPSLFVLLRPNRNPDTDGRESHSGLRRQRQLTFQSRSHIRGRAALGHDKLGGNSCSQSELKVSLDFPYSRRVRPRRLSKCSLGYRPRLLARNVRHNSLRRGL